MTIKKNATVFDLPDVASHCQPEIQSTLDLVGMSEIEVPLDIKTKDKHYSLTGWAQAFVNLADKKTKGIHMSRLFLQLQENLREQDFSFILLKRTVEAFLESHRTMSDAAFLRVSYRHPVMSQALVSGFKALKTYPVSFSVRKKSDGTFEYDFSLRLTYSSTCPCSAALARQIIQQKFQSDFSKEDTISKDDLMAWLGKEESICATPHSQRSVADLCMRLGEGSLSTLQVEEFVDIFEEQLKTPVQAAVKRVDEQEFARLNGHNLMFCEDSCRRLKSILEQMPQIIDYALKVEHMESLHPHNAVAKSSKGLKNGLRTSDVTLFKGFPS